MLRLVLSLFLILVSVFSFPHEDLGEVVFTTILYRHGDRTPIQPYPNDPYKNVSLWPVPWGQLTDIGKRGHYELGKWLRARYNNLLSEEYKRDDIYVRSTDVDRTLMSAYSNLAGLYEPSKKKNWNENILWTPIPVHTLPENMDNVLAGKAPCPRYEEELYNILDSPYFTKINEKYKKLYTYLSQASGSNVTSVPDVAQLYDVLFIQETYNFTLPAWTKTVYPQPMKDLAALSFEIFCFTKTAARLKIGLLFQEILTHMQQKISGTLEYDRKAWMYSAHDTTVANILKSLNLFERQIPPYLSLILIELRKKDEEYFVTMHYKNSTSVPQYTLTIPGCDSFCPFTQFGKIIDPLIPQNWNKECQNTEYFFYDVDGNN